MIRICLFIAFTVSATLASAAGSKSTDASEDTRQRTQTRDREPTTGMPEHVLDRMREALVQAATEEIGTGQ